MFDIARSFYLLRYGQSPEKKPALLRALERLVCRYLSRAYYKVRVTGPEQKRAFSCYFFLVLILRRHDRIAEEEGTINRLIKAYKGRALKAMAAYLKGGE
jgi:hypothetical protein